MALPKKYGGAPVPVAAIIASDPVTEDYYEVPLLWLLDGGDTYWHDMRIDYSSGDLIYLGRNPTHKELEGAATWYIWKFTWVDGNLTRKQGPLIGSWTGRAALAWA